jgi:hypothetical protein
MLLNTKNIVLLLITFLLLSCTGSKHFTKLGMKQEAAGLTTEASNSYFIALQRNRTNLEAQVGLKKNGQLVLGTMLNDFSKQKNFGSNKDAINAYHIARDYKNKVQGVGITLDIPDMYEQDYMNAKNAYLTELYEAGTSLLEEQKFQEAEAKFAEIRKLDPNYKDSKELGDVAYLEPLYVSGKQSMEALHYREAYNLFEKIVAKKADYKDAKTLKSSCLTKGTYTIALLPFENASGVAGLDAKVSAYTLEAMTSIKDPFLRVVDRDNMQAILQEQKLQLSGVIDDKTAVVVGELVGAQALLTGTVLSFNEKKGTLKGKQREAYMSFSEKTLNTADGKYYLQTKYKPTVYTEYFNKNTCTVSFQYKLISLKTGEILKTAIIEKELEDEVIYAKYEGDSRNLVPAGQGGPNLNQHDVQILQSMFQARQDLKSSSDLSNDLFNTISSQMSKEIGLVVANIVK